jgi:hypothetical protein
MSESSFEAATRLGSEAAHVYLKGLSLLLCGVGVVVLVVSVRRALRRPLPIAPRRNDRAALAWIWSAFIVTVWLFSYAVTSVQPRGYYADLLGPDWITTPIPLTRHLAVPLAVLVVCSVLEGTSSRFVTKMNVLALIYVYAAYLVEWTSVPLYRPPHWDVDAFHYVGPRIHGVLVLGSFALEYALIRIAPRVLGKAVTGHAPRS